MPHVIVKLWPGKSEQQKTRLGDWPRAQIAHSTKEASGTAILAKRIQILQRATRSQPLPSCSQEIAPFYQLTAILERNME